MRYPSRAVADLARWAEANGCTYLGVAHSGHVKIRLTTGEIYTSSASPSDVNSLKRAMQDIARKCGIRLKKPRSGHHKRGVSRSQFPAATDRVDSTSARYDALARRHRELCAEINRAQAISDVEGCRPAVRELFDVEQAITELGRRPPLRTFRA